MPSISMSSSSTSCFSFLDSLSSFFFVSGFFFFEAVVVVSLSSWTLAFLFFGSAFFVCLLGRLVAADTPVACEDGVCSDFSSIVGILLIGPELIICPEDVLAVILADVPVTVW